MTLLLDDKARLVEHYPDRQIRSPSTTLPWPAVVTLTSYRRYRGKVRFNRQNVLARDGWACQYCGNAPRSSSGRPICAELTMDHVIPRSKASGGRVRVQGQLVPVTSWQNIVTACRPCNQRKADSSPQAAGLQLRCPPRRPTPWEGVYMLFARVDIPDEWRGYLAA